MVIATPRVSSTMALAELEMPGSSSSGRQHVTEGRQDHPFPLPINLLKALARRLDAQSFMPRHS